MQKQSSELPSARTFNRFKIIVLCLCISVGILLLMQLQLFISWDFRHGLWSPAYLLAHGKNPYGFGAPMQQLRSVWFPMGISLFMHLGWLDIYQASNVWMVLNIALVYATILLAARRESLSPGFLIAALVLSFCSTSVLSHLGLGQFSLLALVLYLVAAILVNQGRIGASAVLIAIALTKPQLGILVVPGLFIRVWRDGRWRAAVMFFGALTLSMFWFALSFWVIAPQWHQDLFAITRATQTWLQPALFRTLQLTFGELGLMLWGALTIGIFLLNAGMWFKLPARRAVSWSLALTALVSPYLWSWDFVLLLPALVDAASRFQLKITRVLFVLGGVLIEGMTMYIRLFTDNSDERFWWVPLAVFALIGSGYAFEYLARANFIPRKNDANPL
jgi:hypothetical protein